MDQEQEKFLRNLYLSIGGESSGGTEEQFREALTDDTFATKMWNKLGGEKNGTYEEFLQAIGRGIVQPQPEMVDQEEDLRAGMRAPDMGAARSRVVSQAQDEEPYSPSILTQKGKAGYEKPDQGWGLPGLTIETNPTSAPLKPASEKYPAYSWDNPKMKGNKVAPLTYKNVTPLWGGERELTLDEKIDEADDEVVAARDSSLEWMGKSIVGVGKNILKGYLPSVAYSLSEIERTAQENKAVKEAEEKRNALLREADITSLKAATYKDFFDKNFEETGDEELAAIKAERDIKTHDKRLKDKLKLSYDSLSANDKKVADLIYSGDEDLVNFSTASQELKDFYEVYKVATDQDVKTKEHTDEYKNVLEGMLAVIGEAKNKDLDDDDIEEELRKYAYSLPENTADGVKARALYKSLVLDPEMGSDTTDSIAGALFMNTLAKIGSSLDSAGQFLGYSYRKFYKSLAGGVKNLYISDEEISELEKQRMFSSSRDIVNRALMDPSSKYTGKISEEVVDKGGRRLVIENGEVIDIRRMDGTKIFSPTAQDIAIAKSFDPKKDKTRQDYRGSTIMFQTGQVISDMVPMILASSATGGTALGATLGSGAISFGDYYKEGLERTGSIAKAGLFGLVTSASVGYLDSKWGKIESKLGRPVAAAERKAITESLKKVSEKIANEGIEAYVKGPGLIKRTKDALIKETPEVSRDLLEEVSAEIVTFPLEDLTAFVSGMKTNPAPMEDIETTLILTPLATVAMSSLHIATKGKDQKAYDELVGYAALNRDKFDQITKEWIDQAPTEQEKQRRISDVNAKKSSVAVVGDMIDYISENSFTSEQGDKLMDLSFDKARATYLMNTAKSSMTKEDYANKITEIDKNIIELRATAEKEQAARPPQEGEQAAAPAPQAVTMPFTGADLMIEGKDQQAYDDAVEYAANNRKEFDKITTQWINEAKDETEKKQREADVKAKSDSIAVVEDAVNYIAENNFTEEQRNNIMKLAYEKSRATYTMATTEDAAAKEKLTKRIEELDKNAANLRAFAEKDQIARGVEKPTPAVAKKPKAGMEEGAMGAETTEPTPATPTESVKAAAEATTTAEAEYINDKDFTEFVDNNKVSDNIINKIADSIKAGAAPSQRAQAILGDKAQAKRVEDRLKQLADQEEFAKMEEEITKEATELPVGEVLGTSYEVKEDGVYLGKEKLDNPDNKSNVQLIKEDIQRREGKELSEEQKDINLLRNAKTVGDAQKAFLEATGFSPSESTSLPEAIKAAGRVIGRDISKEANKDIVSAANIFADSLEEKVKPEVERLKTEYAKELSALEKLSQKKTIDKEKLDLPVGEVLGTPYEVKEDGVYVGTKKIANPENKSNAQLIRDDIQDKKNKELERKKDKLDDVYSIKSKTTFGQQIENKYNTMLSAVDMAVNKATASATAAKVEAATIKEGTEVEPAKKAAFNQGVEEVQKNAKEYKDKINNRQRSNPPVYKLLSGVSKMMAKAYEKISNQPNEAKVKAAYDAMIAETLDQYNFIVSKGLKVVRHTGTGEPYANSKEMLQDVRENNTLKFLPNEVAFGQNVNEVTDNIGLQPSGIKLEDGYELTNSEVFRIVHDYFGHGILGNEFGPIGEENATLQHLDLYSEDALPAVVFQTRGQNSWVNFSGENARAIDLRKQASKLNKEGKTKEAEELLKEAERIFKFAEPKIAVFPNKFNFKRYETARRISEQEEIDARPNKRNNELPKSLERYSDQSRKTRGVSKKSVRGTKRIGKFNVKVSAEYTLDNVIDEGVKRAFPEFKGVQKIYEITDGETFRQMMVEALQDNKFAASVTIHSAKDFNGMRMFVTEDGSTGLTLDKEGFLGAGFSNPNANRPNNLAQLIVLGIKEGATTAEAFDTVLPNYYSNFGLKAVSRTEFNDDYRPLVSNGNTIKDWNYEDYKRFNNGRPDVVFFIYDGGDRNTIEDRIGLFDLYSSYEKENTKLFDKENYDGAQTEMKQQAVKRLEYELEKEGKAAEEKVAAAKAEGKPEGKPEVAPASKKREDLVKQSKARSKEVKDRISSMQNMAKSLFERFGIKTTVVDSKELAEKIRKENKNLVFSKSGQTVTKLPKNLGNPLYTSLESFAKELDFEVSYTKDKNYFVYLDNLTGILYVNTNFDTENVKKTDIDKIKSEFFKIYGVNNIEDLKETLDKELPNITKFSDLESNISKVKVPSEIANSPKKISDFLKLNLSLIDWQEVSGDASISFTPELIEQFKDNWNWYVLSRNPSIPFTPELIREFKDNWDWSSLSLNRSIPFTPELIREFKDNWSWYVLSSNSDVPFTPELIEQFKYNWDWYVLSFNRSIPFTPELIREFKYNWNWVDLSANPSIPFTPELIREFKDKWNWEYLSLNRSIPFTPELISEFKDNWYWEDLSSNPSLPLTSELINKFENMWVYDRLYQNPSLPLTSKLIREFDDKWDSWGLNFWNSLSKNRSLKLTSELVNEFKNKWNWTYLSSNESVSFTPELIREFKDKWNWEDLSLNSSLPFTPELIREFKDNWDWPYLSINPSIPLTPELISEFKDNWDWSYLSRNLSIPFTPELIEQFKDNWGWLRLSTNPSLPLTPELIEQFKDKWSWDYLSRNESLKVNLNLAKKFEDFWDWPTLLDNKIADQDAINYFIEKVLSKASYVNPTVRKNFKKIGDVDKQGNKVLHFFPLFTSRNVAEITDYWLSLWEKGMSSFESATTFGNVATDIVKTKKGGGYIIFNEDTNYLFYSPEDNYSISYNASSKKVKNLKYATRSTVHTEPIDISKELLKNVYNVSLDDSTKSSSQSRDEWIVELKPSFIEAIVINDTKIPQQLLDIHNLYGVKIIRNIIEDDGTITTEEVLESKATNLVYSRDKSKIKGFYDKGTKEAVLLEDAPLETTVHEAFTHPFLEVAKTQNKPLYNNLLKEAKKLKDVVKSVNAAYKDKTDVEKNDEYISHAIDMYVRGELDNVKDKGLIQAIKDFFNQISEYLLEILDVKGLKVSDINENTTLKDLALYSIYGKGTIDLTKDSTQTEERIESDEDLETILETLGKTEKQREKQIEKFFTSRAEGVDPETAKEQAKLTAKLWQAVAKHFGQRSKKTAEEWLNSKLALVGKTTTGEAVKMGKQKPQEEVANNVADEILAAVSGETATPSGAFQRAMAAVDKVASSLSSTGIDVRVIEDPAEYKREAQKRRAGNASEAMFISKEGVIFLNKQKLDSEWGETIVWHEGVHPVINIIRNTDPKLFERIIKGAKELSAKNSGIASALRFAENYRGAVSKNANGNYDVVDINGKVLATYGTKEAASKFVEAKVADEFITETIARITSGTIEVGKLPTSFRQSLIDFMNRLFQALGMKTRLSDTAVYAFKRKAEEISEILKAGKDIAQVVGQENVSQFEYSVGKPQYSLDKRLTIPGEKIDSKEKLVKEVSPKNEEATMKKIDELLNKYPKALTDPEQWKGLMSRVFPIGDKNSPSIPVFPKGLAKMAKSVNAVLSELKKVSEKQRELTTEGLKNTKVIGNLYKNKKMDEVDTGLYFLWNIMSIGISPYPQEAGFLRAVNAGIDKFIEKAAKGNFLTGVSRDGEQTAPYIKEYEKLSDRLKELKKNAEENEKSIEDLEKEMEAFYMPVDSGIADYLDWAASVLPAKQGIPGAGSISNLNAFGKNFLSKASTKIESGEFKGLTKLQALHELLSDRETPTNELRRKWQANLSGMSFNNKIFDFILLTTGRSDLFVIDRVRAEHFWDAKNERKKLGIPSGVSLYDGKELVRGKSKGAGLNNLLSDVPGLLFAELANRTMQPLVNKAYEKLGVTESPDVGRFHWETWVAESSQEVSHGSIDAIVQRKETGEIQDAGIRQGKYGSWDFNFVYRKRAGMPFMFEFTDDYGNTYIFDDISEIQKEIDTQNKRKTYPAEESERIILKDKDGNIIKRKTGEIDSAWYHQEGVNTEKYFEFLRSKAKEIIPAPVVIEDQSVVIDNTPNVQSSMGIRGDRQVQKDATMASVKTVINQQRSKGISDVDILAGLEKVMDQIGLTDADIETLMQQEPMSNEVADKMSNNLINHLDTMIAERTDLAKIAQALKDKPGLTRQDINDQVKKLRELKESLRGTVIKSPYPNSKVSFVVYHGTSKDVDFKTFKIGQRGAFFTANPDTASSYAEENDSRTLKFDSFGKLKEVNTKSRVIPAYINIENLYTLTAKDLEFLNSTPNYAKLQKDLHSKLLREGYDGIDYGGGVYVVLKSGNIVSSVSGVKMQNTGVNRGAVIENAKNEMIMVALESPNVSTAIHELYHVFEGELSPEEMQTVVDSYNEAFKTNYTLGDLTGNVATDVSEWGARLWEKYFENGRQLTAKEVPNKAQRDGLQAMLDKFTDWLKGVYNGVISYTNTFGVTAEVTVSKDVEKMFDKILGITPIKPAKAAETTQTAAQQDLSFLKKMEDIDWDSLKTVCVKI